MPSLSLGTRWLSSLRKYWWANEGGGVSCPSHRATQMNLIRINPLRKRPWVASFIDSPNYSEIQISTARGWLDSICTYFLMRFKWKHVLPWEIPHIIFFESGPRLSFFWILAHHAHTSWLHYGRGAGDQVTRVSTCAPRWRGIAAALQLALITLHHQKQSGYNEEHISGVDTVVTSLPRISHSPGR